MLYEKLQINVVVNTYNEEFILPHWLEHHVPIFDQGIVLDYNSSDATLDIIKHYAPHWTVITAKNHQWFDAEINDKELMECEEKLSGWKICLNTTEFILAYNFREKIKELERKKIKEVRFFGYQINDTLEEKENKFFDKGKNIIFQRFNGKPDIFRHRIIHNKKNGGYYVGRHYAVPILKKNPYVKNYSNEFIPIESGLYLLWYRFAPFHEQISRKIQISKRIPPSDIKKGYAWNHINLDYDKIEERWKKELPNCKNILENPELLFQFEKTKEIYEKKIQY